MSAPVELSFDEILKFMLAHNGKVTNHELVKHFKVFLMNPQMRDEARNTFKKHVNTLAIIKNQNNEKWLILKKKYLTYNDKNTEETQSKLPDSSCGVTPLSSMQPTQPPYRPPPPVPLNQDFNLLSTLVQDYNSVNEHHDDTLLFESKENIASISDGGPPMVHPRRKSSVDKVGEKPPSTSTHSIYQPSISNQDTSLAEPTISSSLTTSHSDSMLIDNEQVISVKERKQMFNRMASESDVLKSNKSTGNLAQVSMAMFQ